MELKSALTVSDIPLPVNYGAEVVELVYEFGQARKIATIFPMGAGTIIGREEQAGQVPAGGVLPPRLIRENHHGLLDSRSACASSWVSYSPTTRSTCSTTRCLRRLPS